MRTTLGKRMATRAGLALLLALSAPAQGLLAQDTAAAPGQGAQPRALEQRLNEEMQAMLLRMVDSGELRAEDLTAVTVSSEPSRRAEFGAIVDLQGDDGGPGLPVLAVTPGGNAAALGLRAGDRLLAVDGIALPAESGDIAGTAAAQLLQRQLAGGDRLSLRVLRDGSERELSGPVLAHSLPGYRLELGAALANATLAAGGEREGCGRISIFDSAPRARHIYPAVLIAIDGRAPPNTGPAFRVSPGRHVLTVAERIDAVQFGDLQRFQRDRRVDGGYKQLELLVEPGITYRLGSRFVLERRASIRDNSYWEPVIWAETTEPCR